MRTVNKRMTRPMRPRRVMAETEVAPEATELLFEAEDVAGILAEATGEDVTVEADGTTATFTFGEDEIVCEAEETDEVVESSVKIRKNRKPVAASTRRPVKAGRSVKKLPRRK